MLAWRSSMWQFEAAHEGSGAVMEARLPHSCGAMTARARLPSLPASFKEEVSASAAV